MSRVNPFHDMNTFVFAHFPMQLPLSYVDGIHLRRAMLQEAVRETAGRCAHIETDPVLYRNGKGRQPSLKFQTAPAHEFGLILQNAGHIARHLPRGLVHDLVLNQYLPGHDQSLRLLTALDKSSLNQQYIKSYSFHDNPIITRIYGTKKPLNALQAWLN